MALVCLQRFLYLVSLFLGWVMPLAAQLDDTHWIPPCHSRNERGHHYLYLTTPELQPFDVLITTGTGGPVVDGTGVPIGPVTISNSAPRVIYLGDGETPSDMIVTLTLPAALNQALTDKGLVLKADKPFYANLRVRSQNQAGSLTAKGKNAMGKRFRIGHVFNAIVPTNNWNRRSNFVGIMATEDNTTVTLSGYAAGMGLMSASGDIFPVGPISVLLMAGESYVISTYVENNRPLQNANGLQGMLVEATAPIVVNCGSWLGAPTTQGLQDIGIDQIVPEERVGLEYITIRGDGPDELETPVVVATADNTEIYINGNPIAHTTLQAGGFVRLPPGSYSPAQNLYIRATQPVYVYQMMGGANYLQTGGLNFVPPLGCSEGGSVNFIMDIHRIGNTTYEGKLLVLAEAGKSVSINQVPVPPGQFQPVPGKPEFVTLKASNLTGNIRVDSDGPLQVGMFGRNNNAGWAGYFSGFDTFNRPTISITLSSSCGDTLLLQDLVNADSVIWHHNDLPISLKTDTMLTAVLPGSYYAVARREFCDEILWDTSATVIIPEPLVFDALIVPVTCPDIAAGSFEIHQMSGGFAPYEISYDGGQSFSDSFSLSALPPGMISFLIRDSMGCFYERDLEIPFVPDIPVIQFALPDTLTCARDTVFISALGSSEGPGYALQWYKLPGQSIPFANTSQFGVTAPGGYLLEVTNLNNSCVTKDSLYVAVDTAAPIVSLNNPPPLTCKDTSLYITSILSSIYPVRYSWMFEGISLQDSLDNLLIHEPGQYALYITDGHNGCTAQVGVTVTENTEPPELLLPVPGLLNCLVSEVAITTHVDSTMVSLLWKDPDSLSLLDSSAFTVWVDRPGVYQVTATNLLNGCETLETVTVGIDTLHPNVDAGMASSLTCRDTLISLQGFISECMNCQIQWTHSSQGIVSGATTITPTVADTGFYFLMAHNPANGCMSMDSLVVERIPPISSFEISSTHPDCDHRLGSIHFEEVIGGTMPFQYSFDGGNSFGDVKDMHSAPAGNYVLVVRDAHGCTAQGMQEMVEIIPVQIQLIPEVTIAFGENYTIQANTNLSPFQIQDIRWSPEEGLSCVDCLNPSTSPHNTTIYTVIVTDMNGCMATAIIRLKVELDLNVFIPNAFHPDGDGINDGFTVFADPTRVKEIRHISIYDRWGNAIFETGGIPINRTDLGWDGKFRGQPLDPAVFIYVIEVVYVDDSIGYFKGDVALIR